MRDLNGRFMDGHLVPQTWRDSSKEKNTGRSVSEETRKKLNKAFSGENNPMYGKPGTRGNLGYKGKKPWNYIDGRSLKPKLGRPTGERHWRWRGGEKEGISHHWNSSKWMKIRKKILERDNHICQYCKGKGHEVHHKVPFRICRNDDGENLITVCRPCHITAENKIKRRVM